MKRRFTFIALICVIALALTSCGNMSCGLGAFEFNKVHIDTHGYSGCVEIEKWYENASGIEVKTKDYGHIYLSEGTYVLIQDDCPLCDAKEG